LSHLEERIELLRTVIADNAGALDTPNSQNEYDLGVALYERFMHVNDISDLVEAETLLRSALRSLPIATSCLGSGFVLGSVLRERAHEILSRQLVEEALSLHCECFESRLELSDLEKACHCQELGLTLREHYSNSTQNRQSLIEIVQQLESAHALFTKMGMIDHICFCGLVSALGDLYPIQPERVQLSEVSSMCNLALGKCTSGHRDFYRVVNSVSSTDRLLAGFCDDMVALLRAIKILRMTLADAPPGWRIPLIHELNTVLQLRFMKQGDEEDLSQAIVRVTTLLDGLSPGSRQWITSQESLGQALYLRYTVTGAAEDLENSIQATELALSTTNITALSGRQSNLGHIARCRHSQYLAFEDITHLNQYIDMNTQLMQLAPPQSSSWLVARHNLGDALREHAEATGGLIDLNQAIELVPDLIQSHIMNHPSAPTMLRDIANTFLLRFDHTSSLDDLERAIKRPFISVRPQTLLTILSTTLS
jgi:hypothetical protein